MQRRVLALIAVLACLVPTSLVATTESYAAPAATPAAGSGSRVVSREITLDVINGTASTLATCLPPADGREHAVSARLIGPARVVGGRSGPVTMHVLVHDAGTGGWFWTLHGRGVRPVDNYARQLAARGETVVVLDRLGYDRSPLRGAATCLNAQAAMLSTIAEHLYAGLYAVRGDADAPTPHASHVVVHGHGTGATIAQLEAAKYRDVQALVLMSPPSTSPSTLALQALQAQAATCLAGASFAPYGATDATYRRLLFASATPAVQRAATRLRNSTPCGDVASLAVAVLSAQGEAVRVPTLVLHGGADARSGAASITAAPGVRLVRRTFAGAGSALPLEKQAPAVRKAVLAFVRTLDDRVR